MPFAIFLSGILGGAITSYINGTIQTDRNQLKVVLAYKNPSRDRIPLLSIDQIGSDDFSEFLTSLKEITIRDNNGYNPSIIFCFHFGRWQTRKLGFHLKAYIPNTNLFGNIKTWLGNSDIVNGGDYFMDRHTGDKRYKGMANSGYQLYNEYFKFFNQFGQNQDYFDVKNFRNIRDVYISKKYHATFMVPNIELVNLYDALVMLHRIAEIEFNRASSKIDNLQTSVEKREYKSFLNKRGLGDYAIYFIEKDNDVFDLCLKFDESFYPLISGGPYQLSAAELDTYFTNKDDSQPIGKYPYE